MRVCVCEKPPTHLLYIGLSSFFGPLPPGLVLGIISFWPVMILNIDLNHKVNLYPGESNKIGSWAGLREVCIRRPVAGLQLSLQTGKRRTTTPTSRSNFPAAKPPRSAGPWSIPWGSRSSGPGGKCCRSPSHSWLWLYGATRGRRAAWTCG